MTVVKTLIFRKILVKVINRNFWNFILRMLKLTSSTVITNAMIMVIMAFFGFVVYAYIFVLSEFFFSVGEGAHVAITTFSIVLKISTHLRFEFLKKHHPFTFFLILLIIFIVIEKVITLVIIYFRRLEIHKIIGDVCLVILILKVFPKEFAFLTGFL